MDSYAIFLDIDGTLTADSTVPKENIEMIDRARRAGHFVFYNTGRSYGHIPPFCKELLTLDGFVAGIGSHIVCGQTILKRERLSLEEVLEVYHRFEHQNRTVIFEGEEKSFLFGGETDVLTTITIRSAEDIITYYSSVPLTKGYISGVLSEEEQAFYSDIYCFYQHDTYAEYSHKGCSKSAGMELILRHLGIPRERCIAIGDSVNDLDMLRYAGISVAMDNASTEIKQVCDMVTSSNEEAGVAKALQSILHL